ncbi:MAG: hypothetical protein AAGA77_04355 [Bacteroidota bacterium]
MKTTKLYRPVNKVELDLIQKSDWKTFPPRLPEQPIFYPVTNQEYASQITREWNLPTYKNGFVTEFELSEDYLSKFKIEKVGLEHHTELWVPAEELEEFNHEIIGDIKVIEAYHENPKKEFVFVESITVETKEILIAFRFMNDEENLDMNERKSIGDLELKSYLSHARTAVKGNSNTWLVRVHKKDFVQNSFKQNTIQEFEFK